MKNVAILINTKNRNEILIKILKYYIKKNFNGKIYIGNASSIDKFKELDNFTKTITKYKIDHFHFPKFNKQYLNGVTIKELLKHVKEKYVIITGDDDFINIENLINFEYFLETNNDYSSCHGYGLHYNFSTKIYFDKIQTHSYEENNPSARIMELLKKYTVLQFSLTKVEDLRYAYEKIENIFDPLLIEIFVILNLLVRGKSKNFNKLHIIRGFFKSKKFIGNKWVLEDMRTNEWHKSINFILDYFDKTYESRQILESVQYFFSNYYIKTLSKSPKTPNYLNQNRGKLKNIYELLKKRFIRFQINKLAKQLENI